MPDSTSTTPSSSRSRSYNAVELDRVAAAVRAKLAGVPTTHPERIGPYKILQTIGEGGMGVVYRAEQTAPIQRVVAIKLIRFGMDTGDVIARFEAERQTLTLLDHPHIAKVLDAGTTDAGIPYFVMEYVAGEPITAYADRNELTVAERLDLFLQACSAVQHAHLKAIIHRDLKPSNILVMEQDGKPWVKVIDFGIAKAIDPSRNTTERALFTEAGQLIGTPEYMAPEQADDRPADIDTRADVYSLGVVLYELLSGSLPLDTRTIRSAGFAEMRRVIREVDPPRPSTRLSGLGAEADEVARRRRVSITVLEQQLQHELEWIPLKALRKEPSERYASAADLAADVTSYIEHRPLRAGPLSRRYRIRKFLRRHRGPVAAAAALVVILLAGLAGTTWQAVRASRAEAQAVRERNEATAQADRANKAEAEAIVERNDAQAQKKRVESALASVREVNRFLTDDLLVIASPEFSRGKEISVREALDRAAENVGTRLKGHPATEAAVRAAIADAYSSIGITDRALPHAQAAAELFRNTLGPDDAETLTAEHEVGRELSMLNREKEAEPILRDVLDRSRRILGPDHPVTLTAVGSLAMTLRRQDRLAEAEPLYHQALEADRRVFGVRSVQASKSLNNVALLLVLTGKRDQAEPLYRESLDIKRELLGSDHPTYLSTLGNLARVVQDQGKLDDARALYDQLLADDRRVLGDEHPSTLLTLNNLGILLSQQLKFEEAEPVLREAMITRRKMLGEEQIDTLQSISNYGSLLLRMNRYADAEPYVREAAEKRQRVLGDAHAHTITSRMNLARLYDVTGRHVEAEALWAALCTPEMLAKQPPAQQAIALARYGVCLVQLKAYDRAEPILLDAAQRIRDTKQETAEAMREAVRALADLYDATARPEQAAQSRRELAGLEASTLPTTPP